MQAFSRALCVAALWTLTSATPAQQTQPIQPGQLEIAPPTVKLLEPGAEPRKPLRLQLKPGDEADMHMSMQMNMKQSMGAMQAPTMKLPAMLFTMHMAVKEVDQNGDVHYEFKCTEAAVADDPAAMPQIVQQMRTSLKSLVGMHGEGVMTNRGISKSASIEIPPNADPMARQQLESMKNSMNQFVSPLPEEPVGVGAKWQALTAIVSSGVKINQTATMTLRSFEGNDLGLDVELAQTADPQPVDNPNVPAGALSLVSLKSQGKGESSVSLNRMVPAKVQMSLTSDSVMDVKMGPQPQQMNQHIEMTMTMGDRPIETPAAKSPESTATKPAAR